MHWFAQQIVNFLVRQKKISDEQDVIDFYTYGAEITVSSILNVVLVLIIGIITNTAIESLLYLCVFILVRSFTGGYHANTYFRCNLLMCASFVSISTVNRFVFNTVHREQLLVLFIIVNIIVILFCPVDNPNKPITFERRKGLKLKAIIVCEIVSLFSIYLYSRYRIGSVMIMLTLYWIAVLILAAKIKERRKTS